MTKINHHFFPPVLVGHPIFEIPSLCLQVEGPLKGAKDEGPAESADKVVKVRKGMGSFRSFQQMKAA